MPARQFSFRFDVDSHRCVAEGMPALLDLARRLEVRFTFFVNFGRLTSRPRALVAALPGRHGGTDRDGADAPGHVRKLPLRAKLGARGLATALLANPRAGARHLDVVRRAIDEGHDVGLHGGRNHRVWQDGAATWSAARVADEVAWGRQWLTDLGIAPAGFSSPGWSSSAVVARAVADAGFAYLADRHGHAEVAVATTPEGLVDVPTNVLGEPRGVGWLEWCRAHGDDDDALLDRTTGRLADLAPAGHAVAYDHPFHAGIADVAMTGRLVELAREGGWEVTTMAAMAAAGPVAT